MKRTKLLFIILLSIFTMAFVTSDNTSGEIKTLENCGCSNDIGEDISLTPKDGFYEVSIHNKYKDNTILGVKYKKTFDNGDYQWHCFSRYLDKDGKVTFYTKNRIFYYQAIWKRGSKYKKWRGNYTVKCYNRDGSVRDEIEGFRKYTLDEIGYYYSFYINLN